MMTIESELKRVRQRLYERQYRAAHKESVRARNNLYARNHRAKRNEYKIISKRATLKMKYGITQEAWDALFIQQGKWCAICGSESPGGGGSWNTDHCHTTNIVGVYFALIVI
jgi:predicted phage tail protein